MSILKSETGKKSETMFVNASDCGHYAKRLREASEWNDYGISQEQCDHAAQQFEIWETKGGEYFSNIIKTPHFTAAEIESILNII